MGPQNNEPNEEYPTTSDIFDVIEERRQHRKSPDGRKVRDLSVEEILSGVVADADYEGEYEEWLLEKLDRASHRRSFTDDGPARVLEGLPGVDHEATAHIFPPGPEGDAADVSYIIECPPHFRYPRYVASYFVPRAGFGRPAIVAGGAFAISVWLDELPMAQDVATRPRHSRLRRRISNPLAEPFAELVSWARALRHRKDPAIAAWISAFPGLWGNYERRCCGHWRLKPARNYKVLPNFYEDISLPDLHGDGPAMNSPGGLFALYPLEERDLFRHANIHTGEISAQSFEGAITLRDELAEAFSGAGVLAKPEVRLSGTTGATFRPPAAEATDRDAESLGEHAWGSYEPDHRLLFTKPEHEIREAFAHLFSADYDAERARNDIVYYLYDSERCAELERRMADPRIPEKRKDIIFRDLVEHAPVRDQRRERLIENLDALIGFIKSLEAERADVLSALSTAYSILDDALDDVHHNAHSTAPAWQLENARKFLSEALRQAHGNPDSREGCRNEGTRS